MSLTIEHRDEMFGMICKMSDMQVDEAVKVRLRHFMGKPHDEIKDWLLGLIEDCRFASLTSSFEMQVLDTVWRCVGGTEEELENRRISVPPTPEEKAKYQWMTQP